MNIATFLFRLALLSFLTTTPALAQVTKGKIHMEERRGAWSSFLLEFPDSMTFRSVVSGNDPTVMMAVDVYAGTCKSNISFIFPFDKPLEKNGEIRVFIDARVDAGSLFPLEATMTGVMGDNHGQISLAPTKDYGALIMAMRAGNTARFRFSGPDGDHWGTLSFSLAGFTYSTNRMTDACHATKKRFESDDRQAESEPPSPVAPKSSPLHDAFLRL